MVEPLQKVRKAMQKRKWTLYLLPRTDEHQSQYIAPSDNRVAFISGFTGSNALVLISQTEALLWTDGRYYLQAQKELKKGWELRQMILGQNMWHEYAIALYPQATIGIDPRLLAADYGEVIIETLQKAGIKVEQSIENIVDHVWKERPKVKQSAIYSHEEYAGKSITEKVTWVRDNIKKKGGKSAIFNDLSEIAWVLNLRGAEIPFNPFFKGVLVVRLEGGSLYLPQDHPSSNSEVVQKHLDKVCLKVQPYEPIFEEGALITKSTLNYYIYNSIKDKNPIEWEGIGLYRAVRTQKQIEGFKRCHVVDGVAMAKFWAWRAKLDEVDEYEAAEHLNQLRYQQQLNKGLSFETMCGGGPNAAVIHYHPTETSHSLIKKEMIHLVDSGGQYLDGTTDVSRTFHFGNPTKEEKDAFTRVLLGNLDVERLYWKPGGLNGRDIDSVARKHLWAKQMDYCHDTGHGVGHFQGVHEDPVGISQQHYHIYLQKGMIVTNEPGYYQPGKFGVRLQNMLLVEEEYGLNWFYNLTLCPYDRQLIEPSLLTQADIAYIDEYHKRVWEELSPKLQDDHQTLDWLKKATSPLGKV